MTDYKLEIKAVEKLLLAAWNQQEPSPNPRTRVRSVSIEAWASTAALKVSSA